MWRFTRALAELEIICQIESCLKIFLRQIQRALSDTSPERRRTPGAALAWLVGFWPTIGAAPPPPRSFVRGAAGRLDFSLQCTAARAGFTQECVCAAFANRLCESLRCLDLRER